MARQIVIPVEGMTCGGCESSIQNALVKMPGVDSVHADHQAKRVQVTFDGAATDESALRRRIEEIGFSVVSNE